MQEMDSRLRAALTSQFAARDDRLRSGDRHLGWKGRRWHQRTHRGQHRGGSPAGQPATATGGTYQPRAGEQLHADVEVAVLVGQDATIAGFGAALEMCDLTGDEQDSAPDIVAHNVFHRAVVLGDHTVPELPVDTMGTAVVNGWAVDSARISADIPERVSSVGRILRAMNHPLCPGDWIITGSVVQVPVRPGDTVVADLGSLGQTVVTIGEPLPVSP
jgi:2-keto-4-pentenoate hydratase